MANVLLGMTGSVASIKAVQLFSAIKAAIPAAEIRVIFTPHATNFLNVSLRDSPEAEANELFRCLYTDEMEWEWKKVGDPVLHIELRRWADILVVAPLDANTLAKAVNGLCDNLLTCVIRAWEVGKKPILVAPSMNATMWAHPITAQQLSQFCTLFGDGAQHDSSKTSPSCAIVVSPVEKMLACGEVGVGAMASVTDIADAAARALRRSS